MIKHWDTNETTAIAHQSWIDYMGHPSKGLTGAVRTTSIRLMKAVLISSQVVAVYIAGEAVGALIQTAIGDQLGRIKFMQLMCVVVTIGTSVQTGAINMGMFLAGRAIAGIAVGSVPTPFFHRNYPNWPS